jgi:hypothetical protein
MVARPSLVLKARAIPRLREKRLSGLHAHTRLLSRGVWGLKEERFNFLCKNMVFFMYVDPHGVGVKNYRCKENCVYTLARTCKSVGWLWLARFAYSKYTLPLCKHKMESFFIFSKLRRWFKPLKWNWEKSIPLGLQLPRTKVVAKETHGEKKPIKTIHANYPTRREEAMHVYY